MTHLLHKIICWYVRDKCGGAFHCFPYGKDGRYVEIMSDEEYGKRHKYTDNQKTDRELIDELIRRYNHRYETDNPSWTKHTKLRTLLFDCGKIIAEYDGQCKSV